MEEQEKQEAAHLAELKKVIESGLTPEFLAEAARSLITTWLAGDGMSNYAFKGFTEKMFFDRIAKDPIWDEITEEVLQEVRLRKNEITEHVVMNIIQGTSKCLGGIYTKLAEKVAEAAKGIRFYG